MPIPKCQVCNKVDAMRQMTCAKCQRSQLVCYNCSTMWKSNTKCPACGTVPPNWQMSEYSMPGAPVPGGALGTSEFYERNKSTIMAQRAQDGTMKHYGTEVVAEDVTAIRELEDSARVQLDYANDKVKVENKRIVEIRIHNLQIDGEKLAPIGKLKGLKSLILSRDQYSKGSIKHVSDKLADCQSLEALALRGVDLDVLPPIPKSVKRLRIDYWHTDVPFPLADILKSLQLEELNLQGNNLDANIFANNIGNLVNLRKLNVAQTKGLTEFPESLLKCVKLEEIDITGSKVAKWPKSIEKMTSLKLVHGDRSQVTSGNFGNVRKVLEKTNPQAYPKIGFADKMKASSQSDSDWKQSLPEPLKKGWSGIK